MPEIWPTCAPAAPLYRRGHTRGVGPGRDAETRIIGNRHWGRSEVRCVGDEATRNSPIASSVCRTGLR